MKLPDDYCLIRADETPKETVRTIYNMACVEDGFTGKEGAAEMFRRAGVFLYAYLDQLEEIERGILTDCGFIGGICGDGDMTALRDLTLEESAKLVFVSCAIKEADIVKDDFIRVICEWGQKQWGEK